MLRLRISFSIVSVSVFLLILGTSCGGKKTRGPATAQAPLTTTVPPTRSADSQPPVSSTQPVEPEDTLVEMGEATDILSRSLEDINAQSPLTDIHFNFDSAALTTEARARLDSHRQWLARYPSVTVLIEGHCDERGTVQYNLALGERRADAVYNYLVSLGIAESRLKTISYGKEFPLDTGHDEAAWAANRRCHFLITSK